MSRWGEPCPPATSLDLHRSAPSSSAEEALVKGTRHAPAAAAWSALGVVATVPLPTRPVASGRHLVARPRRVRCRGCGATQVLLPAALQPRRADLTEVIGTALARKAKGLGYRRIAAALGGTPPTARWPVRVAPATRSRPALAARGARADPARRRGIQRTCEHRQPAARHPDRSRCCGLVGAPTAGHCRARV